MNAVRTVLLILSTVTLLCACQPASESKAASQEVPTGNLQEKFNCSVTDDGLGCIAQACSQAGGVFSDSLKTCSCGIQKTFVVENQVPRCVTKKLDNNCLSSFEGFKKSVTDPVELSLCTAFQRVNSQGEKESSLYVDLEGASYTDRKVFSTWADERFWNEFSYQFWDSPTGFGDYISVGKKITNALAIEGYLKPFNLPDEPVDYLNFYLSPKHFVNAQQAITFISGKTQKPDLTQAANRLAQNSPVLADLFRAYQNAPADLTYHVTSRYEANCLRSCLARSEKFSYANQSVWFEKYYFHGVLYRSEFLIGSENGDVAATMILADHFPSIAMQFLKSNQGVLISASAVDSEGNFLFTKNGIDTKKIEDERVTFADQTQLQIKIGLCEDGVSPENISATNLGAPVSFGPNRASYFGWSSSSDQYWLGRLNLNRYGMPQPGGNSKHATQTTGVLLKSQTDGFSVGVIPLGIESCVHTEQVSTWWNDFKSSGAKVINMSATDEFDKATCTQVLNKHPLITEPDSALWVVAAGNQGRDQVRGCPQHMVGLPNLIIVGANDGSRMHYRSNYGEEVVDIAAPGTSMIDDGWGTSFSTPRVSRVAAALFARYPTLSPFQIKQAIMLGADIPAPALPVKSKGILNAKIAGSIAQGFSMNQPLSKILNRIYCGKPDVTCPLTRLKLEINSKISQKGESNEKY